MLALAGHAVVVLLLAVDFRGCFDECHRYVFDGILVTVIAGGPFVIGAGTAFSFWSRDSRSLDDLVPLRPFLIVVAVLLGVIALAGLSGVLEDAFEAVTGITLANRQSIEGLPPETLPGITRPELVGVAYVAGTALVALLGARRLRAYRPIRPPA